LAAGAVLALGVSARAVAQAKKGVSPPAREKAARLEFAKTVVTLAITRAQEERESTFEGVETKDGQQVLKFATPQYAMEPVVYVPATLLQDFKGKETLLADFKAKGYESTAGGLPAALYIDEKLARGHLSGWSTPTVGSSIYYYLQRQGHPNVAVRIGPFPSSMQQSFSFGWGKAVWKGQ
jgi:hypothetical protein